MSVVDALHRLCRTVWAHSLERTLRDVEYALVRGTLESDEGWSRPLSRQLYSAIKVYWPEVEVDDVHIRVIVEHRPRRRYDVRLDFLMYVESCDLLGSETFVHSITCRGLEGLVRSANPDRRESSMDRRLMPINTFEADLFGIRRQRTGVIRDDGVPRANLASLTHTEEATFFTRQLETIDPTASIPARTDNPRLAEAWSKLIKICRVVADAVTLRLAASLSLQGNAYAAVSTRRVGVIRGGLYALHPCLVHGLQHAVSPRLESHVLVGQHPVHDANVTGYQCVRCRQREESLTGVVTWLVTTLRSILDAVSQRLRLVADSLASVCLQAGHILWESLDDWDKRVLLLERDVPPDARNHLESGVIALAGDAIDDSAIVRFSLLEID